jgi:hypothetical protein
MKEARDPDVLNGDIHGHVERRIQVKAIHASGTFNVPVLTTEPKQSREEAAATASASDRIKLFLILFYDLCRHICVLGIRASRVLIQRLVKTFDNRS